MECREFRKDRFEDCGGMSLVSRVSKRFGRRLPEDEFDLAEFSKRFR